MLEEAAFAGCLVDVFTKNRGTVRGNFSGVDEYATDDERYGFFIDTIDGLADSVYLDEITDVRIIPRFGTFSELQQTA